MMRAWALCVLGLAAAGCTYRPARFHDRPPVSEARDDLPVAIPRKSAFVEAFYLSDVFLRRPVVDALDAERFPQAKDVNALDEVPRSSWFSPIGVEPGAFERQYAADGPPRAPAQIEARGPATLLTDARGLSYRLLGDHPNLPEVDTSASLIASRLVRALGYLTPETWLVLPKALGVSESAGPKSARWVAVRWPVGVPIGATDMTYPRHDDPNDRIPHRDRRTLRALGVLAAWLDLRELGPSRLVDAYVGLPGRGHVRHFVVGLHDALGAGALGRGATSRSVAGPVEGDALSNLLTLGLARPATRGANPERSLRVFGAKLEARYQLAHPYEPVDRLLSSDGYWLAKRMTKIPSSLVERIVREARFSDASLERHVIRALEARRRTLASFWFSRVTPCEVEALSGRTLVLTDQALQAGLESAGDTRHQVAFLGDDGKELTPPRTAQPTLGEIEIPIPELERDYVVVRITTIRRGTPAPRAMEVHLKSNGSSLRLLGVRH